MRRVQLALADDGYAGTLREALCRTGTCHVDRVECPDLALPWIVVLDESSFTRLPLPLAHPEKVGLICRQDPVLLARAWDAGILSVVSTDDSIPTVLLAVMAAELRNGTRPRSESVIFRNLPIAPGSPTPELQIFRSKHFKPR